MTTSTIIALVIAAVALIPLSAVFTYTAKFINAHVKATAEKAFLLRLNTAAFVVAQEMQAVIENDKSAPEKIKADALAKLKAHLGPAGLEQALTILGHDDASQLDPVLASTLASASAQVASNAASAAAPKA